MNNSACEHLISKPDYTIAAFAILFAILTIVCNLMLVVVIQSTKRLHTCTNAFVTSLALSDFIHGCFKMPFVAVANLFANWVPDSSLCHVLAYFMTTGRISATLSLTMLSVDRCIAIYKPVQYSSLITSYSTGIVILCLWIISCLIACIPFIEHISYHFDAQESLCMFSGLSWTIHVLTLTIMSTLIPTLVIIIALCIIVREARFRHRIFAVATVPIVLSNVQPKNPLKTLRAMRSLFFIAFAYLIFCIPEAIWFVVKVNMTDCLSSKLVNFKTIWSMLCCFMTPVIIAIFNKSYHKRLRHLICRKCCRNNSKKVSDFSVSTGLHSILEASYTISHFRPIPKNIILLASKSSRVHLRNSVHANPTAQSRTLFEKPMLLKAMSSPECG
ncbi:melatonin receptor type 1B-A-like [Mytilus californianus]|uniref:melatonin receptor type 1B-A-like n=1 Tax=Mytilus californianus TaxID=6549 RepID=UPI0022478BC5|nr:melatonin receptor type 1B-A-like [Mytilus californianus]